MTKTLKDEIKQTKPFASLEEEVFLNLVRTAEVLGRRVAAALKPAEFTPTQYNVLRILRGAGSDGLPCRELSNRMVTHDPDVTRLLDRMEARGLVRRARGETDRRVVLTYVTEQGLRTLTELDEHVDRAVTEQLSHLGKESLHALNALLESARHGKR